MPPILKLMSKFSFIILSLLLSIIPLRTAAQESVQHADSVPEIEQVADTVPQHQSKLKVLSNKVTDKLLNAIPDAKSDDVNSIKNDSLYWTTALKHRRYNIYDTSIKYPRFLDFCVRAYRWGDKTFNSYDTAYVKPSGKNWKFILRNNNWIDTYGGRLSKERMRLVISSDVASSFGAQLAFMAVSYTYMFDIDNLIKGTPMSHKRMDFSFTCALFSIDFYSKSNSSKTDIHRFGDYKYKNKSWVSEPFYGLKADNCYGIYGYYYFNHRKYSQAAAYCFSKIQKKSAGSFILGFGIDHQNISMDFSELKQQMKDVLPDDRLFYSFKYNDYTILVGYAYSWALRHNWLINLTFTPSFGYRKSLAGSTEGAKSLFSSNIRGKLAVVHNRGRFFYGLHFILDGHWYNSSSNSFFNSNEDLTLSAGIRF